MKKLWLFLGIIALLLLIGYLYNQGIINTDWEWASVILAALAGPAAFLQRYFKGGSKQVDDILQRNSQTAQQTQLLRMQYEKIIQEKEQKIQELQAQLSRLQEKIDNLELERQAIEQQVENATIDQRVADFQQYFGE